MRNSNISLENARLDNKLLLLLSNNLDTNIQIKKCEKNKRSLFTGSKNLNEKIRSLAPAPELTVFDLDPLGRVTSSTEYYEIQYDDVPYKGPEGNLFYVEALGINLGGDSDSCSNIIYDLAQEE